MRGLPLLLLAAVLCSEHGEKRALSLRCYSCTDPHDALGCQPSPCLRRGVCYSTNMTMTTGSGKQVAYQQKGCAPSCDEASNVMQWLSEVSSLEPLDDPGLLEPPKLQVQGFMCCDKDLCNGRAQALGASGGLLLSLGPVLLWALL